jgi:hypothetical protein
MGAKWVAKAVLQKGMSLAPHPQRINYVFQDKVTRSTTLAPDFLAMRIEWSGMHLDALRRLGRAEPGFHAVELGSGWYPIVPLCYFLAGADRVALCDLEDLSRPELAVQAVDGLLAAHDRGELDALGHVDPDRVDRLRAVRDRVLSSGHREALAELGLHVTPGDARELTLAQPPDLISSNTVFEHIPAEVLVGILARFAEISSDGSVMSHLIDLCDHYAYIDPDVSIYHFLRYSDRVWRLIDNDVQPMNRLRASEYLRLYERAGVPVTEEHLRGDDPLALIGEPLAPRFKAMDPADVACNASHLGTRFS